MWPLLTRPSRTVAVAPGRPPVPDHQPYPAQAAGLNEADRGAGEDDGPDQIADQAPAGLMRDVPDDLPAESARQPTA